MSMALINNLAQLATSSGRSDALAIVQAGLEAINTPRVVRQKVQLSGDQLKVADKVFNLSQFKRLRMIAFGKAASEATATLEEILGNRILDGVVIDVTTQEHRFVRAFRGTHPRPSDENVAAAREIVGLADGTQADDLFLVVVSGGGSAMLCWPPEECNQGIKLYDEFLQAGGTIQELNTVRRHLSDLKGGGLAKLLYPATVIGLIFCDVPGSHFADVASGPTFLDQSTESDALTILQRHKIEADFLLHETPKEEKYFNKVFNIPLVANEVALQAMAEKAQALGWKPEILSAEIYDFPEEALNKIFALKPKSEKIAIIAGGEVSLVIKDVHGTGGRNQYLGMSALGKLGDKDTFVSLASDGVDNSPPAGVIVDKTTMLKAEELALDTKHYLTHSDTLTFFEKTGGLIYTGPTGANVSDLMLLLRE